MRGQAELVERSESRRLLDAPLDVVLLFERAALGCHQPEHDAFFALRQEAQRLEAAGAVGVVFEEIAVEVHRTEQPLGDRLVAALRHPGRAEIAAAHMGGDRHVRGLGGERRVDHILVDLRQVVRHRHALARGRHLGRRAQIGPDRVVELQIAAAEVVERFDGLLVDLAEIGKEAVHIRIDVLRDAVLRQPEMHDRRGRNAHFRHDLHVRRNPAQEAEVAEHRVARRKIELAGDPIAFRPRLDAAELDSVRKRDLFTARQPPKEIEVPPGAPVLAVGRELEPDVLLPPDDLDDLLILAVGQFLGGDSALFPEFPRRLDLFAAQDRAHVVGAERRLGPCHCITPPENPSAFGSAERRARKGACATASPPAVGARGRAPGPRSPPQRGEKRIVFQIFTLCYPMIVHGCERYRQI